ncbi:MAG: type II toxin-antitoxin system HigB family toxin [Alphaproteobacteria bacterium]|nr:type II toxin-antitoxin system HigB family toxin [Alphaproteobacteria bacterium]
MRVLKRRSIREACEAHPRAAGHLRAWLSDMEAGNWRTMDALKRAYPSARVLDGERVIFNIRHNEYRLCAKFFFPGDGWPESPGTVYIKFIGTHAEYDRAPNEQLWEGEP